MVWAIGDVHGRADLLRPLLDLIQGEAARTGACSLVLLGDYVDRGQDSRGVLSLICEVAGRDGLDVIPLRGNHDDRMHAFLTQPELGPAWCDFGGRATLASYGVDAPAQRSDEEGWRVAASTLAQTLPVEHLRLLQRLAPCVSLGDYFFAHAGARPGKTLDDQSVDDLMWIREPFLSDRRPFERIVVHGHTPTPQVHADHRRINLDTGAYATGVLSAARFEGTERRLVQSTAQGGRVSIRQGPL